MSSDRVLLYSYLISIFFLLLINSDIEGKVVGEQLPVITNSRIDGRMIRRQTIKIKDETSSATLIFWSDKVIELMN